MRHNGSATRDASMMNEEEIRHRLGQLGYIGQVYIYPDYCIVDRGEGSFSKLSLPDLKWVGDYFIDEDADGKAYDFPPPAPSAAPSGSKIGPSRTESFGPMKASNRSQSSTIRTAIKHAICFLVPRALTPRAFRVHRDTLRRMPGPEKSAAQQKPLPSKPTSVLDVPDPKRKP